MRIPATVRHRSAGILPLVVLCLIGLVGCVALAVDLGCIAIGRNQAQNAADAAAMAAVRSLNGLGNGTTTVNGVTITNSGVNNCTGAIDTGKNVAAENKLLGTNIAKSDVTVEIGIFQYDTSTTPPAFSIPTSSLTTSPGAPPTGYNWGSAQATVNGTVNYTFAKVFGLSSRPVSATAQAIHRPRDVSIILDFSGSMAFDSYMAASANGTDPSDTNPPAQSLNPDTYVPRFGPYSSNYTWFTSTSDFTMTDGEILKQGNTTTSSSSGSPIVEDFGTLSGTMLINAFSHTTADVKNALSANSSAPCPVTELDSDYYPTGINNSAITNPGGLKPWKVQNNTGSTFAITFGDIFGIPNPGGSVRTRPTSPATSPWSTSQQQFDQNVQRQHANNAALSNPTWVSGGSDKERDLYGSSWQNYTYGPGYWGKTFFVWPPEEEWTTNPANPATSTYTNSTNGPGGGPIKDWRQRFFWKFDGSNNRYRLDDNSVMWNQNGTVRPPNNSNKYTDPAGVQWSYQINYDAVLWWIKNNGPTGNLFPSNARSGRILYYKSIPDSVTISGGDSADLQLDKVFWKNYIDYACGQRDYSTTGSSPNVTTQLLSGYGNGFAWTNSTYSQAIYQKPSVRSGFPAAGTAKINNLLGYPSGYTGAIKINGFNPSTGLTPEVGDQVVFTNSLTAPTGNPNPLGDQTSAYYTVIAWDSTGSTITLDKALVGGNITNLTYVEVFKPAYMDYRDNPQRPRMRWWFGPMSFGDFLWDDYISFEPDGRGRYWRPGTSHEAPMWVLKAGVMSALQDIQRNHPNDWVSLIYFNQPLPMTGGRMNRTRSPLGMNYTRAINVLWYPMDVLQSDGSLIPLGNTGSEIRPYNVNFQTTSQFHESPFAMCSTCPAMGFQLAYNQFSGNTTQLKTYAYDNGLTNAPDYECGGNGRRGARKMIIFETDGVPNTSCSSSTYTNAGAYNSYFRIRQPTETPSGVGWASMSTAANDCYTAVQRVCALDTASNPGYATSNKPVLVHTLAFGGLFENNTSLKTSASNFLQQVQTYGKTQSSSSTALPSYKIITGDSTTRINKIKTAFTIMMQDGVQVSLYK